MASERLDRIMEIISMSLQPLLKGTVLYTIPISLLSFALGLVFALAIALAGLSANPYARVPARVYVWIIRCTPILVQLFLIFYGLPSLGILLSPFASIVISLTISEAAYSSEIMRAAILSIPRGQWRAGYALGMSPSQNLVRVILPQAFRICVPSFGNQFITLFKTSSLAALVTIPDLFGAAKLIAASTFEPMLLYLIAGTYYLVLCSALTIWQSRLERRLGAYQT
ncbi:amino acid ABC transporter permease [Cohnella hashimotonis]|uniref:Amino acid ABC transporter permease n=1 Tax=Cohnella hashimotonis TaxID=2826895 RepID=A0ABT6TAI4_9BACL|nr:amino acid ABC transporter permease [Cohnella hashimotonis]MDI4643655.1 amino acid ABC transporter permease [Cohnella hashimotonis]